ncbi:MAG: hydroxyacylglutathione hydrolase [Sulfuricella sp.]|jgi:hydroxyacylglutathione hydrolase
MIEIIPIPAFEDNYIWLIRDQAYAAVVDPGDAGPVMAYLRQHGLKLTAILITHHHGDHCGGARELGQHFDCPVYGPRREKITATTQTVAENDTLTLPGLGATFHVIDVPGHTLGHVAYYGINSLFCGDALFACGCGRLFEGTPEQMQSSLAKFAALPDETKVFCAHEYTLDNIRFARIADPGNVALQEREIRERQTRAQGLPTLPSTIALEKSTNPFLRWGDPHLIAAASQFAGHPLNSPAHIFAAIRQWKDKLD